MTGNDSIYQFNKDDAFRFASALGLKTKIKGRELSFGYCPYCAGGAHRDKGTFAINLDTGQFNCKRSSCGVQGNMITLAKDFADQFELSRDITAYYNINNQNAKFKQFKDAHRITESKDEAVKYLEGRGISKPVTQKYEITVQKDNVNVLVFPFKDENGILRFIKYRNLAFQKGRGSKEWCEAECMPILFGMNHCSDFGTLVITEGQIDSLSLAEAGIKNAVSVPTGKNGFTWKPHCWNWLIKFDEIVVFGDNENGEITLAREIAAFFPKKVRVVRNEDYKGCKDANDILRKYGPNALHAAVDNADVQMSALIKNLADVEEKDLTSMEAIKTGYASLDDTIGGGFHFGDVIILTGKCGDGKSTLASMMIAFALKQKYKVFAYSGELPDFMFKAWLDSQILGKIKIRDADTNAVNAWYNHQIYIYDNSVLEDHDTFKAIEEAVRNLGCRMILIDNLMTAMDDDTNSDLYRQQSMFVKRCAKFAKAYNVIILLVAHPRKGNGMSNDDISGSGDITNLASLVLRYQKGTGSEFSNSMLMVTKNRINGKTRGEKEAIQMVYYPESRRVLEVGQLAPDFFEQPEQIDFAEVLDDEEIPFD